MGSRCRMEGIILRNGTDFKPNVPDMLREGTCRRKKRIESNR